MVFDKKMETENDMIEDNDDEFRAACGLYPQNGRRDRDGRRVSECA
jgi:hypothetical protein